VGGDGAGVRIIDIERGWFLCLKDPNDAQSGLVACHEDFPRSPQPALLKGENVRPSAEHGTSVLGILCAQDRGNNQGGVGIVPHATSVDCVSYVESVDAQCEAEVSNLAAAVTFATSRLGPGDVLLIEATLYASEVDAADAAPELMMPVEASEGIRNAIAAATALGITVVEAGGNGTDPKDGTGFGTPPLDMDEWIHPAPAAAEPTDDSTPPYAECGGIVVSAALVSSGGPPTRFDWAPRGQRVDCFAHGQGVYTTTCLPPDEESANCSTAGYVSDYYPPFGGTSAATAIVAGAVAVIQGLARAKLGAPFTPGQVRAILRDRAVNTEVRDENGAEVVGVMPDLKRILAGYLAL
jgi:hypothetical protein